MSEVAAVLVAMALSGCFAPIYDHPLCGHGNTCPHGLVCTFRSESPGTCEPPGLVGDAAPIDSIPDRCRTDYVAVGSSGHRYKRLGAGTWDQARAMCEQDSATTYLLIPDDATELADVATIAIPPFWIGLDDLTTQGMFMTVKNAPATFLPWDNGEPRSGRDCVRANSATTIASDVCAVARAAICECEP